MTIWPFPFTPLLLLPPAPLLYAGYCFLLLGTRPVEAALGSVVYSSERVISLFCICIQAPPEIKPIKRNLVLSNQPERNSFPNGEFCSSAEGREEKRRSGGKDMLCMGRRKEGSSFGGAGTLEFVITSLTPFPFLLVGRPRSLRAFNGRADGRGRRVPTSFGAPPRKYLNDRRTTIHTRNGLENQSVCAAQFRSRESSGSIGEMTRVQYPKPTSHATWRPTTHP